MTARGKPYALFPERGQTRRRRVQEGPPTAQPLGPGTRRPMLWLGVRLPRLALEVFPAAETAGVPFVLTEEEGGGCRVAACNRMAAERGVRPGLGLNAALALAPELRPAARDPRRESQALERLAAWALQFTPVISLEGSDTLLLEVHGSLGLFGGIEALQTRIGTGLDTLAYTGALAAAPTPLAALWLARAAAAPDPHLVTGPAGGPTRPTRTHTTKRSAVTEPGELAARLGQLPLACTGWPDKLQSALHGMGVHCLRDCLRLPRDGFARRFGRTRLAELDRALGHAPDPRRGFCAPARFAGTLELPAEVEHTGPLCFALQRLVVELAGFLRAHDAGVQRLELGLRHAGRPPTALALDLVRPGREAAHLHALLSVRLERLVLPAPVIAIDLHSGDLRPFSPDTAELFAARGAGDECKWPQLVERLRARLGVEAVHGLCLVPEHRPEAAWSRAEPGAVGDDGVCRERPLWLLSEPRVLRSRQGQPCLDGPLRCERGPERIETGWWDGADVARDYYVMRDGEGVRLWVYRERRAPARWLLHGVFG